MAGFMRLQVWREHRALVRDDEGGLISVPLSEVGDREVEERQPPAWWACYSAPGYMDRTETVGPCASAIQAAREAFGMYGDDEHGSPDRSELAKFLFNERHAQ